MKRTGNAVAHVPAMLRAGVSGVDGAVGELELEPPLQLLPVFVLQPATMRTHDITAATRPRDLRVCIRFPPRVDMPAPGDRARSATISDRQRSRQVSAAILDSAY